MPPKLVEQLRSERGGVTAEFALLLPFTVLVLALLIGALTVSAQKVGLTAAAAEVARLEARGDQSQAVAQRQRLGSGVTYRVDHEQGLRCVHLEAQRQIVFVKLFKISAKSCAAEIQED